jgi:FkbM family methyltransferase
LPNALHHLSGLKKAVGLNAATTVLFRRLMRSDKSLTVYLPNYGTKIEIEPRGSDLFVASQIFGHEEYSLSDTVSDRLNERAKQIRTNNQVPIIIDGGANVGYSALYFAKAFPEAKVIAFEPDLRTYGCLKRNTSGRDQIEAVHGALWSHSEGVLIRPDSNQSSWSFRVSTEGERQPSLVLSKIFNENPLWRPLIVKLDVEGAEREIISSSPDVFRAAACIMVEPHDFKFPGSCCLSSLYSIVASRPMDTLINGENLILLDPELTRL